MGSITEEQQTHGLVRYSIPDSSITADQRSLFGITCNKEVVEHTVPLHNFRTHTGPSGLDIQGFTYVNHQSAVQLDDENWTSSSAIEDIYFPECIELVKRVTGAKKGVVVNSAVRRKAPDLQKDPNFVHLRDGPMDQMMAKQRRDVPLVAGRESSEKSLEPLRNAHMDFTIEGLRATARYARKDVWEVAKEAIEAGDRGEKGVRYAAYSVWRPLRPVKRDGLAVLDFRSLNYATETCKATYRAPSEITESGDFVTTSCVLTPPEDPSRHKWYWMPEQKPDEVLFIKLADTLAEEEGSGVAGGCGHCAPSVAGTENEETRESIEVRVLAVWE